MTDAWEEFCRKAGDRSVAGYVERGDAPGAPGRWAASFVDASDRFRLSPSDTVEELESRTRRSLRGDPHRALIGYAGFDAVSLWEPLLRAVPSGSPFPLGEFAVFDRLRWRRTRLPRQPARLRWSSSGEPVTPRAETLPSRAYQRSVRRLHRAIGDGDAFQVVLATRRRFGRPDDLLERVGRLRAFERFAYFYYLRFDDREIVGASPESVVELRPPIATVHPIAGTLPRAQRPGRRALSQDPKELAEHRMLVDLARNDLGRISEPGSVRVAWRERGYRFARLQHLVSRVDGRVVRGTGPWAALAATFPAGTVSGAPKIRATQLIRREEATWRGPYAGTVGLLTGDGDAAWALAIRTAFAAGSDLYTAAGAGIVWDSQPEREYDEVRVKLGMVEASLVGRRGR